MHPVFRFFNTKPRPLMVFLCAPWIYDKTNHFTTVKTAVNTRAKGLIHVYYTTDRGPEGRSCSIAVRFAPREETEKRNLWTNAKPLPCFDSKLVDVTITSLMRDDGQRSMFWQNRLEGVTLDESNEVLNGIEEPYYDRVQPPKNVAYTNPPSTPMDESWKALTVVHLNDKNFREVVSQADFVLVMFYAPWCPHCKKMRPDFVKAAEELSSEGLSVRMAFLNCLENPEVADEYGIVGFPTVKLFRKGKVVSEYNGSRTIEDIKGFVKDFHSKGERPTL